MITRFNFTSTKQGKPSEHQESNTTSDLDHKNTTYHRRLMSSPPRLCTKRILDSKITPTFPASLPKLFWFFFYNFGLFAWGGSVAQIVLIKYRLVIKDKWITLPRFQRVFAVYRVISGPEAAELSMFFGYLSAGRIGGIVAGIGFILPGFILMFLASYLYSLILRVAHKIGDHSVIDQSTRKVNPVLVIAALFTALNGALRINIFVSLGLYGIINPIIAHGLSSPASHNRP